MICDNMVFKRNRLLIINELLKETEFIAVEELKKRLQIINLKIDRRGIDRDHLIPLTKEGVIEYGTLSKSRDNKPPKSVDAVRIATTIKALRQLVVGYTDIMKLQSSAYYQNVINPSLLREIEKLWNINVPYKSKKEFKLLSETYWNEYREKQAERGENGISEEDLEYIYSDKIVTDKRGPRAPYYFKPNFFTEEDVLEILKLSQTALINSLKGTSIKEKPPQILLESQGPLVPDLTPLDTLNRAYFEEILLASLILDSGNCHYPNHYFKTEISIKIRIPERGEIEKRAGMIKDHSTYQYFKTLKDP